MGLKKWIVGEPGNTTGEVEILRGANKVLGFA